MATIAIRREPPGRRAAPLTPSAVATLVAAGHRVLVTPHAERIIPLSAYLDAGACAVAPWDDAERSAPIPPPDLTVGVAHPDDSGERAAAATADHPGEPRHLSGRDLMTGEDEASKRFRARFARLEGAVLAAAGLHALGKKLYWLGFDTPLDHIHPPGSHDALTDLLARTASLGRRFSAGALPPELPRLTVALAGTPDHPRIIGACEVLDTLPTRYVDLAELPRERKHTGAPTLLVTRAEPLAEPRFPEILPGVALLLCLEEASDPADGSAPCRARIARAAGRPLALGCGAWRARCAENPFRAAGLAMHTLPPQGCEPRPGFRQAGLTVTGEGTDGDLFPRDLSELLSERFLALLMRRSPEILI